MDGAQFPKAESSLVSITVLSVTSVRVAAPVAQAILGTVQQL